MLRSPAAGLAGRNHGHAPDRAEVALGNPSFVWRFGQDRRLNLIRHFAPLEGARILDIGCGLGVYVRKFREFSDRVYGIDIDREAPARRRADDAGADALGERDAAVPRRLVRRRRAERGDRARARRRARRCGGAARARARAGTSSSTRRTGCIRSRRTASTSARGSSSATSRSSTGCRTRCATGSCRTRGRTRRRGIRRTYRELDVRVLTSKRTCIPGFDNIIARRKRLGGVLRAVAVPRRAYAAARCSGSRTSSCWRSRVGSAQRDWGGRRTSWHGIRDAPDAPRPPARARHARRAAAAARRAGCRSSRRSRASASSPSPSPGVDRIRRLPLVRRRPEAAGRGDRRSSRRAARRSSTATATCSTSTSTTAPGLRSPVKLEDISPWMIAATISTEDASFWTNPGVNTRGLVRAGLEALHLRSADAGSDDRRQLDHAAAREERLHRRRTSAQSARTDASSKRPSTRSS